MIGAILAKRKVHAAFDSLSRHRIAAFMENWDEDATFIHYGRRDAVEEAHGKDAITNWFKKFAGHYPLSSFTVKNICVDNIFALGGNNVITVVWEVKMSNKDGEEFDATGLTLITARNGKAFMVRDYIMDHRNTK